MKSQYRTYLSIAIVSCVAACGKPENTVTPASTTEDPSISIVRALSADELSGRKVGTEGNARARGIIEKRMIDLGVKPFSSDYEVPFTFRFADDTEDRVGINLIGIIEGSADERRAMVVSAHFDHLGEIDGEVYNGADDNASGVAGILAIAEYFIAHPPGNDVIVAAFDAEEGGLNGAKAFVANPPLQLEQIAFNLNLDMISRGDNGLLWVSGVSHSPGLEPMVKDVASRAPVTIKMGYDSAEAPDDWTAMSDHAPFFRAGIPHLYLGVEDHPDYHKPSDDFEKIDQSWFLKSVETAVLIATDAESRLTDIATMRRDPLNHEN